MRRLPLILLVIVALAAGCGSEEKWGGYTEGEAKQIMGSEQFRQDVINLSPPGGRNYADLLPNEQKIDQAGLRKVTLQKEEAWEYRDSPNEFCVYLWKSTETGSFTTQVGPCAAD